MDKNICNKYIYILHHIRTPYMWRWSSPNMFVCGKCLWARLKKNINWFIVVFAEWMRGLTALIYHLGMLETDIKSNLTWWISLGSLKLPCSFLIEVPTLFIMYTEQWNNTIVCIILIVCVCCVVDSNYTQTYATKGKARRENKVLQHQKETWTIISHRLD